MGDGLTGTSKRSIGSSLRCYVNYEDDIDYFEVMAC
jgi:hypothetical protein